MASYLITGAAGYIGSMLVKHIRESREARITVLVRDRRKAEGILPSGVEIITADLADSMAVKELKVACDYLIHCASVTKSAEMVLHPVEVTSSIVNATQNMMELARRCDVRSAVYLSSMEVYGSVSCSDGQRITEDKAGLGSVNVLESRSCYPLGKRMAENICFSYYKEFGVPVKIARLAQTFGSGVLQTDTRVFMQFARAVKEDKDIVLHTKGESVGNYCGIHDAVRGIMTILEHGDNGEAYNVVNETLTMTIHEMAEFAARQLAGGRIQIIYDIPEDNRYGYAAGTGLRLSGKKLENLGWRPEEGLAEMYRDVVRDL